MEALFRSHAPSFSKPQRPRDTYHWLEDDDDGVDILQSKISSTTSQRPISISSGSASKISHENVTNGYGKRPPQQPSPAAGERDRKRMKVAGNQHQASRTMGQANSSRQPETIDLSVSPPPMHRTGYAPNHQNGHPRQAVAPPAKPTVNQYVRPTAVSRPWEKAPPSKPLVQKPAPQQAHPSSRPPARPEPAPKVAQTASTPVVKPVIKQETNRTSTNWITRSTPNTSGPFVINDDSDDETSTDLQTEDTSAMLNLGRKATHYYPPLNAMQREEQAAESRRRRQQAAEIKRETPQSFGGWSEDAKQPMLGRGDGTQAQHVNSVTDWTTGYDFKPVQSARPCPENTPSTYQAKAQNVDEEHSLHREHIEAQQKKQAELRARVQALDDRDGNVREAWPQDSKPRASDREHRNPLAAKSEALQQLRAQTEARNAAKAMQRADSKEDQRAQIDYQEVYRKQIAAKAEATARSRAKVEAQKKIDAQKEAEAKKELLENQQRRQKEWDERKKAEEAQREAMRKRTAQHEKDRNAENERQAALARLSAARPQQPTPISSFETAIGGKTNINKVVAKHAAPQRLHFKDDNGSNAADAARQNVKDIQERNAQAGLFQSKPKTDSELAKVARIEAKRERNASLKEAEAHRVPSPDLEVDEADGGLVLETVETQPVRQVEEHQARSEDTERRDSGAELPAPLALPKGPQSLSSKVGQALLARSKGKAKTPAERKSHWDDVSVHQRRLGEIMPEDVQIIRWRDEGVTFKEIATLYGIKYGVHREHGTYYKRHRQVKGALQEAGVEEYLWDLLMGGSSDAKEKVNRAVHGKWPLDGGKDETRGEDSRAAAAWQSASFRQRDEKGHFLPVAQPTGSAAGQSSKKKQAKRADTPQNFADSFDSTTTDRTLAHVDIIHDRPQTGGKMMNEETMRYYLEGMAEVWEEQHEQQPASREPSPITDEDRCHFAYQVQRRELPQADLDEGFDFEEGDHWMTVDEPLDNLRRANKKAILESYTVPAKWKDAVEFNKPSDWKFEQLDNGMELYQVTWKGAGKAEICTTRFTRYHRDGHLPKSKDGWASRTVYHVHERTVQTSGDDVFAEKKELDVTQHVDNASYTTLEEANHEAVKHFVSVTYTSNSANLVQRTLDEKRFVERLEKELEEEEGDEGDDALFWKQIETEDGRFEVWVEEGELRGPRNL